jgi:hypothetical protein
VQGNGAFKGLKPGIVPMELIETLRNISVQEAFAKGRSAEEISDETACPSAKCSRVKLIYAWSRRTMRQ